MSAARAALLALCALALSAPAYASQRMYDMGPLLAEKDPLASPAPARYGAPAAAAVPGAPPQWRFTGAVGVQGHHQDYTEPSLDVNEQGAFTDFTLDGRASYGKFQIRGETRFAWGQMKYSSPGNGEADKIDDFVFEGRFLLAREFALRPTGDETITPYFGFGYRRLSDSLGGVVTTTGAVGYDRLSQYYYLPVGIEALIPIDGSWAIAPTVEYDHLLYGTQDSDLSQVSAGLSNLHNEQHHGSGLRAALMARTEFEDHAVEFGPFVRYWHVGQSNSAPVNFSGVTIGNGFEPGNHTVEAGLGMKVWF